LTQDADPQVLTSIGEHYVVDRVIGRGGMATVYLCRDTRDNTRVAVKVLRKELGSAIIVERFLREISFASELDHPRIPKVLDSGVIDGLPYYAMTYVEGESLKHKLEREKQLRLDDAIRIACQVIAPTAYAHSRGIVHRDIKPDNILIAADGVYVLDFGIARAIIESGVDRLTSTGVGIGTPAYMSPEQALGDRNLDARSDVYSLGCVVYEMIAGIPPFVGPTSQAIISRRFAAPPPPLSHVRDSVPEEVEDAVQRALARSPADRWSTVAEFGAALEACSTETATGAGRRARASSRRRLAQRIAAAAAIVVVIAAGVAAWSRGRRSSFEKAQDALQAWDLNTADQEFDRAVAENPGDAAAQLWLAQVKMLADRPVTEWRQYALHASDNRAGLAPTDQVRADAIVAFASDKVAEACQLFDRLAGLTRQDGTGYTATLGLADCLVEDRAVVPDLKSPSGFKFRASRHRASSLYEGLLERNKNRPAAYAVIMPRLEHVLPVDKGRFILAHSLGDKKVFLAHPSLAFDTLAYTPYPVPESGASWRVRDPRGFDLAIVRNRQRLRALGIEWTRRAPDDPSSHETLARIFESTGELTGRELSALNEISLARKLSLPGGDNASNFARTVRLGSDEVRLNLRLTRFQRAGILADSILSLAIPSDIDDAQRDSATELLTSLAALRGRGLRAIELELTSTQAGNAPMIDGGETILPPSVVADYVALNVYSAFGGPGDSVVAMSSRLSEKLPPFLPGKRADAILTGILLRPLMLAAPVAGPQPVAKLGETSVPFALALKALARGDRRSARNWVDSLTELHAESAPGEITMDVVHGEAWLSAVLGDTTAAITKLDNALQGLSAALPSVMKRQILAASLVRVMALRAELAAYTGQPDVAKYWSNAVFQLWGRGDSTTAATLNSVRRFR
jgi:tRNA A-37 threonylcarbamoyl transferase component Bud32